MTPPQMPPNGSQPQPAPPNIGQQMGVGSQFMPGPATFRILPGHAGGDKVLFLIIDHSAGITSIMLSTDGAKEMARQLTEMATGLTLPTQIPPDVFKGKPGG